MGLSSLSLIIIRFSFSLAKSKTSVDKMKVLAIFAIILPYVASRSVEVQRQICRSNDPMCKIMHERSLEEMAMSPRALDPKGYKVNIVVFYDDAFAKEFGSKAEAEVKKIVSFANGDKGFGHMSLT